MMEIESKRLKGSGVGKYKGLKQITFVHKLAYDKLLAYKQEAQKKGYLLKMILQFSLLTGIKAKLSQ